MFPGLNKDLEFPEELANFHASPTHIMAYMLRNNIDLDNLSNVLKSIKYSNDDTDKVTHLIKMLRFKPGQTDPETLENLLKSHLRSGLSNRNVSDWFTKVGKRLPHEADAFFQHLNS